MKMLTRERQIANLGSVAGKKLERLLDYSRKLGQIRMNYRMRSFLDHELEKEQKELKLIISELVALGVNESDL